MYYLIPKKEVAEANECIPYVAKAPKIVPKKRESSVPTKRNTHGTPDHIGKFIKESALEKNYIKNIKTVPNHRVENIKDKEYPRSLVSRTVPLEEVKGKTKETYEKNYVVTMNMNKGQLLGDFQLGDQDCRDLGPCICSECSGKNDDGVRVWKVTNSLYELKMHSYTVHNGIISEGTLINYEKNDDEDVFIKSSNEYFMMRRNGIEEKYRDKFGDEPTIEEPSTIKVYGWNSVSACTPENKVLINAFLEQNRADILMLNDKLNDKDTVIAKVSLKNSNKSFIVVCA